MVDGIRRLQVVDLYHLEEAAGSRGLDSCQSLHPRGKQLVQEVSTVARTCTPGGSVEGLVGSVVTLAEAIVDIPETCCPARMFGVALARDWIARF